jgi:hypothetical protein
MIATKHLTPAWVYDRELTTFKTYSTLVCLNAAKLALCLLPLQQMAVIQAGDSETKLPDPKLVSTVSWLCNFVTHPLCASVSSFGTNNVWKVNTYLPELF